jgi:hypothetical protein
MRGPPKTRAFALMGMVRLVGLVLATLCGRGGRVVGITHSFVSAKADGGDATLVTPSAWNAGHTLDSVAPSGLTGATAASRYVGATASGAPASGTFSTGDFVIDQMGKVWVCTAGGTSGTWVAVGGSAGALVLLEQHTASASATLDFTTFISSTYDEYAIEGLGIVPATNGASLLMRVGTGAGPTYDTGSNYYGIIRIGVGGGSSNGTGGTGGGQDGVSIAPIIANAAGYGQASFSARFVNPQSTSLHKHTHGTSVWHNGTEVFGTSFGYLWASATAVTAIRFLMSSGNIASGIIRVYGIAKS